MEIILLKQVMSFRQKWADGLVQRLVCFAPALPKLMIRDMAILIGLG
jgi:hypothetical protein